MINTSYQKYFAIGEEDKNWGLYILDCGSSFIPPGEHYPSADHPKSYELSWNKGRILHEYQFIYLVNGNGIFESKESGSVPIVEGTLILLFPEVWHRYKPDPETTWNTYWIGFQGEMVNSILPKLGFTEQNPCRIIGYQDKIVRIFMDILESSQLEFTGYQQVMAGEVLKLFGWIYAIKKRSEFREKNIDRIMQTAKLMLIQIEQEISIENVAEELTMSYSKFRKIFKDYTGLAPGEFRMQHRINKATELLIENRKSIKEISIELGFESTQYFSRVFKKRTRYTPGNYKNRFNN